MFSPGSNFGNNVHLRKLIKNDNEQTRNEYTCFCFKDTINNKSNLGYNDSTRTDAARISNLLSTSLGGRIIFGNFGVPASITYLGGIEGQSGGSPQPIRNKF
jgi:hypothetical protein